MADARDPAPGTERAADAVDADEIRRMHALDDHVVIVTGAGRGVGRGIALHLGKAGARIVVAEYQPEGMERTTEELAALGVPSLGVVCDVSDHDEIASMVEATVEHFGRLDALVNNAQTFRPMTPVATVPDEHVDVLWRSGVKGTLWAMQAAYPHMRAAGRGRVVNFASAMGITGGHGFAAYNASKEAIRAITRTAAREWAGDGIVVNAVAPAAAAHHGSSAPGVQRFLEDCPMGRHGDPELDIASVVHFLCSDACRYLTGHTFMVDGGSYMWA